MTDLKKRPTRRFVLAALTLLLLCANHTTFAIETFSGRALAERCEAQPQSEPYANCKAYVQGVLDALETLRVQPDTLTYCLPSDMTLDVLAGLYLSESRLYPEVLDTPASRLIAGMLYKFFPCIRADQPRTTRVPVA